MAQGRGGDRTFAPRPLTDVTSRGTRGRTPAGSGDPDTRLACRLTDTASDRPLPSRMDQRLDHRPASRAELDAALARARRLEAVVSNATDAIVSIDASHRITLFNQAAERVFGYPAERMIGQPIDALLPPEVVSQHARYVNQFGAMPGDGGRPMGRAARTVQARRVGGELFPIEASISKVDVDGQTHYTVILRDVTERERVAAELHAAQAIIENASDAIITIDETHRITLFNRAAEQVFGHAAADMMGQPLDVLLPPDTVGVHERYLHQFAMQGAQPMRQMGRAARKVYGRRANGELFPIDAAISKVDAGGRKLYTVILRDVSERERAAAELAAARDEIRRLSAIAQVAREGRQRRLAQELHEELAQDLAALKFGLGSMAHGLDATDSGTLRETIRAMAEQLDTAMSTVRRVAGQLQPLLLDDLGLQAAIEWLIDRFHQRHDGVDLRFEATLDWDRLDKGSANVVFRVVQEALDNVGEHAGAQHVQIEIADDGEQGVRVRVRDDGRGFDVETLQPAVGGAVGLIELGDRLRVLEGELDVDSAPGRGTTLVARLPYRMKLDPQRPS